MTTNKLPYWARKYVQHIEEFCPHLHADLMADGSLETVALSIQESASSAYDMLFKSYCADSNEKTAEMLADSEVMRTLILIPPEED
jgi:hypothetical protein